MIPESRVRPSPSNVAARLAAATKRSTTAVRRFLCQATATSTGCSASSIGKQVTVGMRKRAAVAGAIATPMPAPTRPTTVWICVASCTTWGVKPALRHISRMRSLNSGEVAAGKRMKGESDRACRGTELRAAAG